MHALSPAARVRLLILAVAAVVFAALTFATPARSAEWAAPMYSYGYGKAIAVELDASGDGVMLFNSGGELMARHYIDGVISTGATGFPPYGPTGKVDLYVHPTTGKAAAVWTFSSNKVMLAFYDPARTLKWSMPFEVVNSPGQVLNGTARVAVNATDGVLVTWQENEGDGFHTHSRYFTADGADGDDMPDPYAAVDENLDDGATTDVSEGEVVGVSSTNRFVVVFGTTNGLTRAVTYAGGGGWSVTTQIWSRQYSTGGLAASAPTTGGKIAVAMRNGVTEYAAARFDGSSWVTPSTGEPFAQDFMAAFAGYSPASYSPPLLVSVNAAGQAVAAVTTDPWGFGNQGDECTELAVQRTPGVWASLGNLQGGCPKAAQSLQLDRSGNVNVSWLEDNGGMQPGFSRILPDNSWGPVDGSWRPEQMAVAPGGDGHGLGFRNLDPNGFEIAAMANDPAPPAYTAAPVVTGDVRHGQTLTTTQGTWTDVEGVALQWQRESSPGTWQNLPGQTATTYTPTADDVGKKLRVKATGYNDGPATVDAYSAATVAVLAGPPTNRVAPPVQQPISGPLRDGRLLSLDRGLWSGASPLSYEDVWLRCNADGVSGCVDTGAQGNYFLGPDDVGKTLKVQVTASNPYGELTVTSPPTGVVQAWAPENAGAPTINGTAQAGQTVSANRGGWFGTDLAYTYQWQQESSPGVWEDIEDATDSFLTLTDDLYDKQIRVQVTADNSALPGGAAVTVASDPQTVAGVAAGWALWPQITGTFRDGETLEATTGMWVGVPAPTFERTWMRCADSSESSCEPIDDADDASYTLTGADVGNFIRHQVTGTNDLGSDTVLSNNVNMVQAAAPDNTTAPAISGTTVDGEQLTVSTGVWSGSEPIQFTVQWQRQTDASWENIAGAENASYTLTDDDYGHQVRAQVTADNSSLPGGGTAAAHSDPTAPISAAAPVQAALPQVTGTARHGETLTGTDATFTGTEPMTITRSWLLCDADGDNCADIPGATGATLELTNDHVGATVRLRTSADNSALTGGAVSQATSTATGIVAAQTPSSTAAPTVDGVARDGETLTGTDATFTGSEPMTIIRSWQACDADGDNCADISGATGVTLELDSNLIGKTIRFRTAADNSSLPSGGAATDVSAPTAVVEASAPVNTVAPEVTGTARDLETLSADDGDWTGTGPITLERQWQREVAGDWVNIPGADGADYELAHADVGHRVRVAVTADNPAAGTVTVPSTPTVAVAAAAPANTGLPTVSGTARDRETLTGGVGTWTGTPTIELEHQWQREVDGTWTGITGADELTYTLTGADIGHRVRLLVTATNAADTVTETSTPTDPVAAIEVQMLTDPTLTGTAKDGETLTVDTGEWDGSAPITFEFDWYRCDADGVGCEAIDNANEQTYTLTADEIGGTVRASVMANNPADAAAGAITQASAVVEAAAPQLTAAPALTGSAVDGQTLTVYDAEWSGTAPITQTRQWQREVDGGWEDIAGADQAAYTLTSADVGHRVRVAVTADNPAAGVEITHTDPTGVVAALAPSPLTGPSVSGEVGEGETLTADPGTWAGTTPMQFDYQWIRCNADGTGCEPIDGATEQTYTLTQQDVGKVIVVEVQAGNDAGTETAPASDPEDGPFAGGQTVQDDPSTVPAANTTAPQITGTVRQGVQLTAQPGGWAGSNPITFVFQWQRQTGGSWENIAGADQATYTPTAADVNQALRVQVTATNPYGTGTAHSAATAPVQATDSGNGGGDDGDNNGGGNNGGGNNGGDNNGGGNNGDDGGTDPVIPALTSSKLTKKPSAYRKRQSAYRKQLKKCTKLKGSKRIRCRKKAAAKRAVPVTFTLTADASVPVKLELTHLRPGQKAKRGKCTPTSRKVAKAKRCVAPKAVSVTVTGAPGANRITLPSKLDRRLVKGKFTFTLSLPGAPAATPRTHKLTVR